MKTVHISLGVTNVDESIAYYASLFGREPDVAKPGFAKWWLDDPRLNFALTEKPKATGLHHLGIQVDDDEELTELYDRTKDIGHFLDQGETTCCYAKSKKGWSADPQGVPWELFLTTEHLHDLPEEAAPAKACC